jgi:hypothetical protein
METTKYCVCNNNGDLAGHDLDLPAAEQNLAEMISAEPDSGWEIIGQE